MRISRAYYPGGALRRDVQITRTWYPTTANGPCDPVAPGIANTPPPGQDALVSNDASADWSMHQYNLDSEYDLDGRRTKLTHTFPQSSAQVQQFAYDLAETGELATVTAYGRSYSFERDPSGNWAHTTMPGGVVRTTDFDGEGRTLRSRVLRNGSAIVVSVDSLAYDAMGRVTQAWQTNHGGVQYRYQNDYNALGAVVGASEYPTGTTGVTREEEFVTDAIGNRRWRRQFRDASEPDHTGERNFWYDFAGALDSITFTSAALTAGQPTFLARHHFAKDLAGNQWVSHSVEVDRTSSTPATYEAAMHFYGPDNRLRVFNRHLGFDSLSADQVNRRGVYEEYRHDALGRRIATRSRLTRTCPGDPNFCYRGYLERTVWDGDQVLADIRADGRDSATFSQLEMEYSASGAGLSMPYTTGGSSGNQTRAGDPKVDLFGAPATLGVGGLWTTAWAGAGGLNLADTRWGNVPALTAAFGHKFGVVVYLHGGGLDAPLEATQGDLTLIPHANWRGIVLEGTLPDGTIQSTCEGSTCRPVDWPAVMMDVDRSMPDRSEGSGWFGSLLSEKTDGSGLQYMRNRYYDPASGQFTQEDPIGLAGGMNLYGFAGGDPVNYADPFGLCPDGDPECEGLVAAYSATGAAVGFLVGGGTGALETVLSGGVLAPVAVAQTAAASGLGAAVGGLVGEIAFFARSATSGESGAARSGRARHAEYSARMKGEGYQTNQQLPGTRLRPDAWSREKGIVRELKPNTPTGRAQGARQLREYRKAAEAAWGRTVRAILDLY